MNPNLKKVDYKNKKIFVGLDVHQKTWYTTILFEGIYERKTFPSKAKNLSKYLQENYPNADYKIGYEAGCFGFWIKEQLDKLLKTNVLVLNAADIPTSGKDKTNKTDARDSLKIAQALASDMVTSIYCPSRESQEHRDLMRRRMDLVRKQTRVKNQIKAKLKYYGISYSEEIEEDQSKWTKAFILWLSNINFATKEGNYTMRSLLRELDFIKEEIKQITKEIGKLMKTSKYIEDYEILRSCPGIGGLSAAAIKLEIIDIQRFKEQDHFTSFLGLAPTEHSSGEKQSKGHLTGRCNRYLRTILIESAWVSIRVDPAMKLYYADCCKRMAKPKAIIKVARKLANRLRYLLKTKMKYVKGVAS